MFIRVNSTPNSPRRSVQVVENNRIDGKVKTKILRHVGIAMDEEEVAKLKKIGEDIIIKIMAEREREAGQMMLFDEEVAPIMLKKKGRRAAKRIEDIIPVNQVTLDQIVEEKRIIEGVSEIGSMVFNSFGFDELLKKKHDTNLLKDIALTRLVAPCSKHKTHHLLTKQFNKEYQLQAIYRLMDKLHPLIDAIKVQVFNKSRRLFAHNTVDLMLFDVTTLYFESVETDDLRNFGYSKDHRFNTTQVVLALATNEDGLPIGYELFPGNTAEVKTLIAAIEKWKTLFNINDVCFVGDRAMFCEENLKLLEKQQYKYIVAAKLRNMSSQVKQQILDEENYSISSFGNEIGWIAEFLHNERRLICSYKSSRAKHDQHHRDKILDKLQKIINKNTKIDKFIRNNGVKKFTSTTGKSTIEIDQNKIEQDANWDGIHGVITNIKDLDPVAILSRYKRLWIIEDAFRVNKSNLDIRPIYHFKKERIESHIAICYMSFAILKYIQYHVCLTKKISVNDIIESLLDVQASIYIHKQTKDRYRVPGKMSHNATKIYQAFNLNRSTDASIYLQ